MEFLENKNSTENHKSNLGAMQIDLGDGKIALLDAVDYARLSRYKWRLVKGSHTFYAAASIGGKRVLMHRAVLFAPKGLICDHKNHDGLDNRRGNLRLCTPSQNNQNRRKLAGCASKHKGVRLSGSTKNKWQARIWLNGIAINLGCFDSELTAGIAYDRMAGKLFGDFAYLNFPELVEFRRLAEKLIFGT